MAQKEDKSDLFKAVTDTNKKPVAPLNRAQSVPFHKGSNSGDQDSFKTKDRSYTRADSDTLLTLNDVENKSILQLSVVELQTASIASDGFPRPTSSQGWINNPKKADVTTDPVSVADQIAMMPIGRCRPGSANSGFARQVSESSVSSFHSLFYPP